MRHEEQKQVVRILLIASIYILFDLSSYSLPLLFQNYVVGEQIAFVKGVIFATLIFAIKEYYKNTLIAR